MLRAVPDSWFSWDFTIFDDNKAIAKLDLAWVREAGELSLEGANYKVFREGLVSGAFILEKEGSVLASAGKTSVLVRSFNLEYNGTSYTLEAESMMLRKFVLRTGGKTIGSVRPETAFTRRAIIDLPIDIALPVRIFMVWLILIIWKRDNDAA